MRMCIVYSHVQSLFWVCMGEYGCVHSVCARARLWECIGVCECIRVCANVYVYVRGTYAKLLWVCIGVSLYVYAHVRVRVVCV